MDEIIKRKIGEILPQIRGAFTILSSWVRSDKKLYKEIQKQFLKRRVRIPRYILKQASLRTSVKEDDILKYLESISYNLDAKAAEVVKRPISNLINYLAQQKLEEEIFVDQIEMDEIVGNKILIKSLKQGSKDAKLKKGTFVDV